MVMTIVTLLVFTAMLCVPTIFLFLSNQQATNTVDTFEDSVAAEIDTAVGFARDTFEVLTKYTVPSPLNMTLYYDTCSYNTYVNLTIAGSWCTLLQFS